MWATFFYIFKPISHSRFNILRSMVNLICQSGWLTEITQDLTNVWNINTVCGVQLAFGSCLIRLKKNLAQYIGILYETKRTLEPIAVHISPDQLSNFTWCWIQGSLICCLTKGANYFLPYGFKSWVWITEGPHLTRILGLEKKRVSQNLR